MSFYATIGYRFKLPGSVEPDGGVLLASSMPAPQLLRRRFDNRYPHLKRRIFDPQLYLAGLDPNASRRHCAILGSYPWFGVQGLEQYDSSEQKLSDWRQHAEKRIPKIWPRRVPNESRVVTAAVAESIDMQERLGCEAILLPSPLTVDQRSDYSLELVWLDAGLGAVPIENTLPVFATVAISDVCLAYIDPEENGLLEAIADAVSARGVDGVYLVVEQATEPSNARLCGSSRTLASLLHLVHVFSQEAGLRVYVNFAGPFGLACVAAGAEMWSSAWYKSLVRLRVADTMAGGRAYPTYWTRAGCVDIHLESDFDSIRRGGMLPQIADRTLASEGLLRAAQQGKPVSAVPAWAYRQSNVTAAREHYYRSLMKGQEEMSLVPPQRRVEFVEDWLESASTVAERLEGRLYGTGGATRLQHVPAWLSAFQDYRRSHGV